MVAKAGGYFGRPFKGNHRVMQGYPLSPTIFNVFVEAVIRHWVTVVLLTEAVTGGLGLKMIDLAAYFFADDRIVALNQPEMIQMAVGVLAGLFGRVVLRTNITNTVCMVCQPCHTPRGISEEVYMQWVTGKGPTFWEHRRMRVEWPDC